MYVCVCVCCSNCGNIKHGHEQSEKRPNRADQANSGQTELTKATQTKATVGVAGSVVAIAASVAAASVVAVAAFGWCRAIRELQQQQQPRIVWTCRPETKVIAGKCCGQMFNMQKAGWRPLPLSHSSYFSAAFSSLLPHSRQTAWLIAPLVFPFSYFVFPPIFS